MQIQMQPYTYKSASFGVEQVGTYQAKCSGSSYVRYFYQQHYTYQYNGLKIFVMIVQKQDYLLTM